MDRGDDGPTAARASSEATNPEKPPPHTGEQSTLFDRDGGPREPPPHQHGLLRLLVEPGNLLPVRSRIASLSESSGEPVDGHDDLQLFAEMGCSRERSPAVRAGPPDSASFGGSCGEGLWNPVPGVCSMASGKKPRRATSGRTVAVLRSLPFPSDTCEDPGRGGVRRCGIHRRGRASTSRRGEGTTAGRARLEVDRSPRPK